MSIKELNISKTNSKTFSITVSENRYNDLKEAAERNVTSVSAIINYIIDEYDGNRKTIPSSNDEVWLNGARAIANGTMQNDGSMAYKTFELVLKQERNDIKREFTTIMDAIHDNLFFDTQYSPSEKEKAIADAHNQNVTKLLGIISATSIKKTKYDAAILYLSADAGDDIKNACGIDLDALILRANKAGMLEASKTGFKSLKNRHRRLGFCYTIILCH